MVSRRHVLICRASSNFRATLLDRGHLLKNCHIVLSAMQCVRVICQVCLSAGVIVCLGGDLSSQRDGVRDRPCSQGGRAVSRSLTLWLSGLHRGCGALPRHSSRCVSVFSAVACSCVSASLCDAEPACGCPSSRACVSAQDVRSKASRAPC